jgi:methyl-accepting chemotaxis protein
MPTVGALAIGLVLVLVAGWLLGNYITRPINMLEEGLLAILNGQADKRFELDHAELGGLAFRIDQLLNQLMGVEEDTTDDEGRVSRSPRAGTFNDSLEVEDKKAVEGAVDPDLARRLAAEAPAQYYARIYGEYIAAKKAIGEPTDHISEQAFAARIQSMEQDAAQKYGRPVRYQVHARNKEVVLLAVPL